MGSIGVRPAGTGKPADRFDRHATALHRAATVRGIARALHQEAEDPAHPSRRGNRFSAVSSLSARRQAESGPHQQGLPIYQDDIAVRDRRRA